MKKTAKKNKNEKFKTKSFDNGVEHKFKAEVKLGPGKIETIEFSLKANDSECLTYDEVEFAAYDKKDAEYPKSYYPKAELNGLILIKNDSGNWCPVLSESDKKEIKEIKESKKYDMFLVLPDAVYSVTPEYSLYMKMVEIGAIDPDKFEFDYEKMHSIVESSTKKIPQA